ncbi:MAG: exopolyphosphatase [Gammaproteobacteria bacterium]|nr:exopolyphosphatase [Gammaproteobacteria bacterium]
MTDSDFLSETPFIAAVDLGSNSFHMKVVRVAGEELEVIDRIREMVRLASGLDDNVNLTEEAIQRAIACLSRFGERLRDIPSEQVRVVGTNTLRRAGNARQFIRLAQLALGHPIEIIGGQEEARLVYLGVSHSVRNTEGRMLVVDIGGGSTELIIGRGYQSLHLESVFIGCVSLSLKFFRDGSITRKRMQRAITEGRLHLEPLEKAYRSIGWEQAIGSSGTIRAIEKVVIAHGWSDDGITPEALARLQDELVKAGHVDAIELKGLGKDRAPVFPGGVAALSAVFEGLKIERMWASDGALREGLLYDLVGRTEHDSVREQAVATLMSRYQVDLEQAARVEQTALDCFSQLAECWQLDRHDIYRQCLIWAARLHEVGLAIAHSKYQKRGEYIIRHSDMLGFTRNEQQIVATLIRAHRYKFPSTVLGELSESLLEPVTYLCIVLRIAVLLRRGRSDEQLPEISIKAKNSKIQLKFPEGWLKQHALTQADLKQEKKYLRACKMRLAYK